MQIHTRSIAANCCQLQFIELTTIQFLLILSHLVQNSRTLHALLLTGSYNNLFIKQNQYYYG